MFKRIRTAAVLASALIASAGCDGRGGGSPTGLPPSSWEAAIATAEGLEVTRFGLGGQTAELSNGEDESQTGNVPLAIVPEAGNADCTPRQARRTLAPAAFKPPQPSHPRDVRILPKSRDFH